MKIVVGFDSTPAAAEALRWAARYARAVGAELHAVHAYVWKDRESVPVPTGLSVLDTSENPREVQPPEEVSQLFASVQPDAGWTLQAIADDPGPLLTRQAAGADLLVVGTGEHVGLGRLLVGSVSHYCLSHATCPVVAVPAPQLLAEAAETAESGTAP